MHVDTVDTYDIAAVDTAWHVGLSKQEGQEEEDSGPEAPQWIPSAGDCGLGSAQRSAELNGLATNKHQFACVRSTADSNVAGQIRLMLLACCKPLLCKKEPMTAASYTEKSKCCQGCAAALTFCELM